MIRLIEDLARKLQDLPYRGSSHGSSRLHGYIAEGACTKAPESTSLGYLVRRLHG